MITLFEAFRVGVAVGSVVLCLLITGVMLLTKGHKVILYEKRTPVLVTELLILIIGLISILAYGVG